jgi:hypothetical protein
MSSLFGPPDSLKFPDFSDDEIWTEIARSVGPAAPTKETVLYNTPEEAAFFLAMQAEGFWYFWDNGRELTDERLYRQLKDSERPMEYQAKFLELYANAVAHGSERPRTTAIQEFVKMINAEAIERSWQDHFAEVELEYAPLWTRATTKMATFSKKTFSTVTALYSEFVIQYVLLVIRMGGLVMDGMFTGGHVVLEKTGDLAETAWEKSGGREFVDRNRYVAYATVAVAAVGVLYQITKK